jgi:putative transposase
LGIFTLAGTMPGIRRHWGKLVSPERRRRAVDAARERYALSERTACWTAGQPRGTQRYVPTVKPDEDALTWNIVCLVAAYGRYGYRRITAVLNEGGIEVGKDRVQRIWRREGLKVPKKQPRRSRLWLNDGSCIRLRPEYPNHVWSFDFVETQTHDGRRLYLLTLIDEYRRKCLAIRVARRIIAIGVIETLADAMLFEGIPVYTDKEMATISPLSSPAGFGGTLLGIRPLTLASILEPLETVVPFR